MLPEKSSRIDVADLKAMMLKKIGPERFKQYFYCLDKFINKKLSKVDFNRSCLRVLGKENLPLHNHIIRSILKNAYTAKAPPPVCQVGPTYSATAAGKNSAIIDDGHLRNGFALHNQTSSTPIRANGVVLPMSPRKVRSVTRERKLRDRPSPLGPNGKTDSASHYSTATEDSGGKTVDDGELMPCDYQRPIQHFQGLAEQPEIVEKLRLNKCSDVPDAILGNNHNNVAIVEEGEEVEQGSHSDFSKRPLVAPLGIPFCSASVGGVHKSSSSILRALNFLSSVDSGVLPDSEMLRQRMEQIAAACGLAGGVTMECANSLNNMVDVYLKRLIKSCVELIGESSKSDPIKNSLQRQQMHNKLMNGLWPSNHLHMQSASGMMEGQRAKHLISVHDFKVAMELQPQQLGEDWPLLMEKISMQSFEE